MEQYVNYHVCLNNTHKCVHPYPCWSHFTCFATWQFSVSLRKSLLILIDGMNYIHAWFLNIKVHCLSNHSFQSSMWRCSIIGPKAEANMSSWMAPTKTFFLLSTTKHIILDPSAWSKLPTPPICPLQCASPLHMHFIFQSNDSKRITLISRNRLSKYIVP